MSTPSHPDENETAGPAAGAGRAPVDESGSPGSGARPGVDGETTTVGGAPVDGEGSAGSPGQGSSGPGAGGTPPPWARGGASAQHGGPGQSGPGQGGPGQGGPGQGGPGQGGPGQNGPGQGPGGPQGGPPRPPISGSSRPGGPGPGRGDGPPPGPGRGPDSGATPAQGRGGPGGPGPGGPGDGGSGERPQRGSTALIDAPTNQLSPEQLGMRRSSSGRVRTDGIRGDDDEGPDLAAARSSSGKAKAPRRASLQVKRFDPWSVLKLALVLGVALFFVWMFAVGVLYAILDGMGVWAQLNGTYQDLTSDSGGGSQLITAGGVFGVAAIIGVVNTILFTAIASVSAFIYNISADVAGGIELTLSERD